MCRSALMIGFATAVVLGLLLIVDSVNERPRRVVDAATGQCLGIEVPSEKAVEVMPCQWLVEHPVPTDKDLFVNGSRWKALHPIEN